MSLRIALALLTLWCALPPAAAELTAVTAQEVAERASATAYYQGADGKAVVAMTIEDAQGRLRSREFTILRTDLEDESNGEQRFYVLFSRPADVKNTAFMVWKYPDRPDDRWLYLPALDLVKRIAAGDQRTSFVGSHFYYEDVSGRAPTQDHHLLIDSTDVYYILESTPRDPGTVEFASYRSYIHKQTYLPVKIEYFDAQGERYRHYTALRVDTIEGYPTVIEAEMVDERIGGKTRLAYSSVDYDLGLPAQIYTERYLRAPPRRYLR